MQYPDGFKEAQAEKERQKKENEVKGKKGKGKRKRHGEESKLILTAFPLSVGLYRIQLKRNGFVEQKIKSQVFDLHLRKHTQL